MENETEQNWLEHRQYQTILRLTHTIAFEFNLQTGEHLVSPFISETLAGNYDNRQLSRIMLEDDVLHPDDTPKMTAFRDLILAGKCKNETMLSKGFTFLMDDFGSGYSSLGRTRREDYHGIGYPDGAQAQNPCHCGGCGNSGTSQVSAGSRLHDGTGLLLLAADDA